MSELSYEDAVANLQGMFTRIEPSVIGAVLESCGFQLEMAIEQLLALDPANDSGDAPVAGPPTASSDVVGSFDIDMGGESSATAGPPGWRHPLPEDFLAVPGSSAGPTSTSQEQMIEDAALAEMLSNELFLDQLRSDPEFAAYLGQEAAYLDELNGAPPASTPKTSIKSKLSTMGTGMKKRFAGLAARFRRGGKTPSSAHGGEYSSLLEGEPADTTTIDLDLSAAGGSAFALGDSDDEDTLARRPPVRAT